MTTKEHTTHTPPVLPTEETADPGANLDAVRAEGARLHAIARAALEKVSAQNAEKELETRRQRGGE
jgi:hypothetical protein